MSGGRVLAGLVVRRKGFSKRDRDKKGTFISNYHRGEDVAKCFKGRGEAQ